MAMEKEDICLPSQISSVNPWKQRGDECHSPNTPHLRELYFKQLQWGLEEIVELIAKTLEKQIIREKF